MRQIFAAPGMDRDGRKTPMMDFARRTVAGELRRKTVALAAERIERLEIAALLAARV